MFKKSYSLWQYYRDESSDTFTESELFKFKLKVTGSTPNDGNKKDVKIAVPLQYLSDFWRNAEMLSINCEINLILTWSTGRAISSAIGAINLAITSKNFVFQL